MLKLIVSLALVVVLGAGTYALAGGDGNGKRGKSETKLQQKKRGPEARQGHGPPPWAKAYGRRCKDAGNTPGSQAFKDCIKASKQ